jgi:hypothetical protein
LPDPAAHGAAAFLPLDSGTTGLGDNVELF